MLMSENDFKPICIGKISRRHCCYFCFLSTRAEQILVRKSRRFLLYCPILIDLNLSQYLSRERGDTIGEVSLADNRNHHVFVYQVNVFAGDCVIAHANVHGEMKTNVQPPHAPRGALTLSLSLSDISERIWFSVLIGEENDKDSSLTHLNKWHHWIKITVNVDVKVLKSGK